MVLKGNIKGDYLWKKLNELSVQFIFYRHRHHRKDLWPFQQSR